MSVVNGKTSSASRFRRRSSIGSMPSSIDAWSTMRSSSAVASGRPAPRYAPIGVVLVAATTTSNWMPVNRYVPLDIRRVPAGQERADAGIGATVADQSDAQSGEGAVALAAELDVLDLPAAVRQRQHVFAARRRPHDGSLQPLGRRGDDHLLGVHAGLAAEPAADERGDDSDLVLVDAERAGQQVVQEVRHLRRAVDEQPTVVVDRRRGAVRLHRRDGDSLVDVATADDRHRRRRTGLSLTGSVVPMAMLSPCASNSTGASSASASSAVTAAGSGS